MCGSTENIQDDVEESLGFPLAADHHWRSLLCAITNVEDMAELEAVLNEHISGPVDERLIIAVLKSLQHEAANLAEESAAIERYQGKLQPWLVKTNFPYTWPVVNTGKKETARLMAKGEGGDYNLLTFNQNKEDHDYSEWATAMLSAGSLEDYLAVVNEDLLDNPEAMECVTALLDLYRDNDQFSISTQSSHAFIRVLVYLQNIGLFDLLPDSVN